jgi:hypothetical protein
LYLLDSGGFKNILLIKQLNYSWLVVDLTNSSQWVDRLTEI